MTIHAGFLDAAVRITSVGDLLGTGFLATVPSEMHDGHRWGYVITAHHVIASQIEIAVQAPVPWGTGRLYGPVGVVDWRQPLPGVDLAVAPWRPLEGPHPALPHELMIPTNAVAGLHLGTTIYYFGIFEPLMRPILRSGTLAALDVDGVPHDDYEQPVDVVDCRSYKGFSGSPCLVEFRFAKLNEMPPDQLPWAGVPEEMWAGGEEVPRLGGIASFALVCGMFIRHFSDDEAAGGVTSRYGVGMMIRSCEIKEALMTAEMREERRRWDEELDHG